MNTAAARPGYTSKGDVLIVDDHPDALRLLTEIVGGDGYRCLTACNGMEAIWLAVCRMPDLILLDLRMPGMHGLDVCQCLKHHPVTASIPVIIVSAADSPEDRIAGFEAGAADFIGKPYVDTEVLARVHTHIQMALIRKDILWRRKIGAVPARGSLEARRAQKEILVVEDSPESLQLLADILKSADFVVREAPNGELALWSAIKHPPDLVLLDIRMPGQNGIDICLALKMSPTTSHIPVIFISAFDDAAHKADGFTAGAVDFVTKPFDEGEVLARVRAHLRMQTHIYRPAPVRTDADSALDNPQQALKEAFALSACAIMMVNAQGKITYVNPSFVRLTGHALDDAAGLDQQQLFSGVDVLHPASTSDNEGGTQRTLSIPTRDRAPLSCEAIVSTLAEPLGNTTHVVALTPTQGVADPVVTDSPAFHEFASFALNRSAIPGLENAIHDALPRQELRLLYQPIFDMADKRLVAAEALLRWQHPRHGSLLPSQFLMIAEETGETLNIGRWVADQVASQFMAWCGSRLPGGFALALNLSALQFWQDDLLDDLSTALNMHGMPAERLMLEIAAETLGEDLHQAIAILHRLKGLGVMLVLDRYGTGTLSADELTRLPVDRLKLDPLPILSMNGDPRSQEATRDLVNLAHDLGMAVVANGIEQKWHLSLIESYQCEMGQGYLLGMPLPAEQFFAEHLYGRSE